MTGLCIFCLGHGPNPPPWVPDNPGAGCQYGLAHEFPGALEKPKPAPVRKVDLGLCTKCGLHLRNPASATSGCAHEYPAK